MKNKNNFEVCVRGIIVKNGKILVCKRKDKNYYFLPGGHVEFGESAESALKRELKEELNLAINKTKFIGTNENLFKEDSINHHEINLFFIVNTKKVKDKSMEDYIDFFFFDKKRFIKEKIFPTAIKKQIIKYLKDKKLFWISNIEI